MKTLLEFSVYRMAAGASFATGATACWQIALLPFSNQERRYPHLSKECPFRLAYQCGPTGFT